MSNLKLRSRHVEPRRPRNPVVPRSWRRLMPLKRLIGLRANKPKVPSEHEMLDMILNEISARDAALEAHLASRDRVLV